MPLFMKFDLVGKAVCIFEINFFRTLKLHTVQPGCFFINPPVPVGRGIGWEGLKFNGPPRDRLCRWIHRVSAVKITRRNLNNTGKFLWPLDVSDLIRRKIPVLPRWGGKGVYKVGVAKIKGNISFCTQL